MYEASSVFVVKIAYYLFDPDKQHPLLIDAFVDVIENVCHNTWFLNISGEVLNSVLGNIRMDIQTLAQSIKIAVSLFMNLEMLENFLDNKSLFIAHTSQLIIIGSFMVSILRSVRTESTIDALSWVIRNCKAIGRSTEDRCTAWRCSDIIKHARHLLHLIATPFTGPSELSNSRCLSVVTQFEWRIVDVGEVGH
ncbi:hypothetical protein BU17DRAFT_68530 [Hysterangium stoloniferum]|nr:hypothetical protein BU17DRAFT_68530 [Hysterangium stoloniferum]